MWRPNSSDCCNSHPLSFSFDHETIETIETEYLDRLVSQSTNQSETVGVQALGVDYKTLSKIC